MRGRDGYMGNKYYCFEFDWGETWIVRNHDLEWNREYWWKVVANHIHYFREKIRLVKVPSILTSVSIYLENSNYIGMISVSDNYVHGIINDEPNEFCWRVEDI